MKKFSETGRAELRFNSERFDRDFVAASVSNEETIQTVKKYYETFNYLVDPHTAVGISVAEKVIDADVPLVCLSTAHPAKFNDVMAQALPGVEVTHPSLEVLKGRETRKIVMDADIEAIKSLIKETQ
jgi:threonine synthase